MYCAQILPQAHNPATTPPPPSPRASAAGHRRPGPLQHVHGRHLQLGRRHQRHSRLQPHRLDRPRAHQQRGWGQWRVRRARWSGRQRQRRRGQRGRGQWVPTWHPPPAHAPPRHRLGESVGLSCPGVQPAVVLLLYCCLCCCCTGATCWVSPLVGWLVAGLAVVLLLCCCCIGSCTAGHAAAAVVQAQTNRSGPETGADCLPASYRPHFPTCSTLASSAQWRGPPCWRCCALRWCGACATAWACCTQTRRSRCAAAT